MDRKDVSERFAKLTSWLTTGDGGMADGFAMSAASMMQQTESMPVTPVRYFNDRRDDALAASGERGWKPEDDGIEPPPPHTTGTPHIPSSMRLLRPFTCRPYEDEAPTVYDSAGKAIVWPWRDAAHTDKRMRTELPVDTHVRKALASATASGSVFSTGTRAWVEFCNSLSTTPHRPMDPNSPLWLKLEEEWLAMRFVCYLVETRGIKPRTAASYLGDAQGWHLRTHGIKLAAGIKLGRLTQMLKGLRRLGGDEPRKIRRGVRAKLLRVAMDKYLDPKIPLHANKRAAFALAFQGLLRGAEFTTDKFDPRRDMTRADLVSLTDDRAVVMMRPSKNMAHLSGKTVPLVIGGGGKYIDAVAELNNLVLVDKVRASDAQNTPLFRSGKMALNATEMRRDIQYMMSTVGQDQAQFGLHSLRIGGATALFAAGADPIVIRTMGRWSSDCYRLYVRACFEATQEWTVKAGTQDVTDIAGEFDEVDSY